jgi:DNA-binding transcriptional ArsR family regulator
MDEERRLAILRYVRDHEGGTAQAIARHVFGAPRTTFGRPLKLSRASSDLQTLVQRGLLAASKSGTRTTYLLSEPGRTALRDASLGSNLSSLDPPQY